MNKKERKPVPFQRRVCCTTFLDQPHRADCAFKARSREYNAGLRKRLDAARERGKQKGGAD